MNGRSMSLGSWSLAVYIRRTWTSLPLGIHRLYGTNSPTIPMSWPCMGWRTKLYLRKWRSETSLLSLIMSWYHFRYDAIIYARAFGTRNPGTHNLHIIEDGDHNFSQVSASGFDSVQIAHCSLRPKKASWRGGRSYSWMVVSCRTKRSTNWDLEYRNKRKAVDVLSYFY